MHSTTIENSNVQIPFAANLIGQRRVNQLGGMFINGRPLPPEIRLQIVQMYRQGIKPCKISRDLRVSHGAVSKILNRYNETGSISPGQIGGNPRSRLAIQVVERHIQSLKEENFNLNATEIRDLLIKRSICTKNNAPTVSSINRHLRARGLKSRRKQTKNDNINNNCNSKMKADKNSWLINNQTKATLILSSLSRQSVEENNTNEKMSNIICKKHSIDEEDEIEDDEIEEDDDDDDDDDVVDDDDDVDDDEEEDENYIEENENNNETDCETNYKNSKSINNNNNNKNITLKNLKSNNQHSLNNNLTPNLSNSTNQLLINDKNDLLKKFDSKNQLINKRVKNGLNLIHSIETILGLNLSPEKPTSSSFITEKGFIEKSNTVCSSICSSSSTLSDEENCSNQSDLINNNNTIHKCVNMKRKIKFIDSETFSTTKNQVKTTTTTTTNSNQFIESNNLLNNNEYRRNRTSFNDVQLKILQDAFYVSMYPDENYRKILMTQTGLDEDKIITWFSNRRARWRKLLSNGMLQTGNNNNNNNNTLNMMQLTTNSSNINIINNSFLTVSSSADINNLSTINKFSTTTPFSTSLFASHLIQPISSINTTTTTTTATTTTTTISTLPIQCLSVNLMPSINSSFNNISTQNTNHFIMPSSILPIEQQQQQQQQQSQQQQMFYFLNQLKFQAAIAAAITAAATTTTTISKFN